MLFNFILATLSPDPYEEKYTKKETHAASTGPGFCLENYIVHYDQKLADEQLSGYKIWWYQINGDIQECALMGTHANAKVKKSLRYLNKSSETV